MVVWLFVLLAMVLNVVAGYATIENEIEWEYSIPGTIGLICGELCVVALVGGLTGKTWLTGYLQALSMMVLGYLAIVAAFWIERFDQLDFDDLEPLSVTCVLPWLLLLITSPLFVFRQFGWRLLHKESVSPPTKPFRIADLLHGTAMVAATLAFVRVPEVIEEMRPRDFWLPLLVVSGILFTVSLIAVPIAVRVGFGTASRMKSVIGLVLLAATAYVIIVLVMQCFSDWNTSWDTRAEALLPTAILVGAAVAVLYPFIFFFSWTGIVLVRKRRGQATNAIGDSQHAAEFANQQPVPRSRWKVAAFVGAAIVVNIGLARLQDWRRARDQEIAQLEAIANDMKGRVGVYDREVFTIELGSPATDADFEKFAGRRSCDSLTNVRLASPELTDRTLETMAKFPLLNYVTIHSAAITDDGLAHLANLKNLTYLQLNSVAIAGPGLVHLAGLKQLTSLDLTGTLVSGESLAQIAANCPITELTLDRTKITDTDCAAITRMRKLLKLSLKGTAVSDQGLRHLWTLRELSSVDLSDTSINGTGLAGCWPVDSLTLDNTQVDDESMRILAKLPELHSLDLAGTKITDKSIELLMQHEVFSSLGISNTDVTDQGVALLAQRVPVSFLDLSGNRVTGEGFRNWPRSRDLQLVLADTLITDSNLPLIAKTGLSQLWINGTKVTFNGLIAGGFFGLPILNIRQGQFSDGEIKQLETKLSITVQVREFERP